MSVRDSYRLARLVLWGMYSPAIPMTNAFPIGCPFSPYPGIAHDDICKTTGRIFSHCSEMDEGGERCTWRSPVRLQKLVLERCDLCLLYFANGLYKWGYGKRIFWEKLIPWYDFTITWHGNCRNEMRVDKGETVLGRRASDQTRWTVGEEGMDALPTTLILENKIDRHLGQGGRDPEVYGVFIESTSSVEK